MKTTIEYNSKLAVGDEVIFYLDGEKFIGKVEDSHGYWINFSRHDIDHVETVEKIFAHFGISDKYEFRNRIVGGNWDKPINGIWPCTNSLEELKKMLDEL